MEHLCDRKVLSRILEKHGFSFSKMLGQNFLVNRSVCPKIAQMGILSENAGVVEVGTGIGVLTTELCQRAKKVVAIELDRRLQPVLAETLAEHQNLEIIWEDVLKLDLNTILKERFLSHGIEDIYVCANLPYYITSPILMMLLENQLPLKAITVMVQKEAAVRLLAAPGVRACGAISFAVRYFSEPRKLFSVSRGSFFPAPNVDSAVIQFRVTPQEHTTLSKDLCFALVKQGFSQRRKTLVNPLSSAFGISKEHLQNALLQIGIKPTVRAEEITFENWIALSNTLHEVVSNA